MYECIMYVLVYVAGCVAPLEYGTIFYQDDMSVIGSAGSTAYRVCCRGWVAVCHSRYCV